MELTAPDASGGVAAGGAGGLLDVVGPAAAPPAQRVGLVAPLTCDPEPAQTSVHGWTLVGAQPSGVRAAHSCSFQVGKLFPAFPGGAMLLLAQAQCGLLWTGGLLILSPSKLPGKQPSLRLDKSPS